MSGSGMHQHLTGTVTGVSGLDADQSCKFRWAFRYRLSGQGQL